MPDSLISDLNSKHIAGHADVEKQLTHETATVPIEVPKTLGAGVSNADHKKDYLAENCRQRFLLASSRRP
jgi:hypothetical protein